MISSIQSERAIGKTPKMRTLVTCGKRGTNESRQAHARDVPLKTRKKHARDVQAEKQKKHARVVQRPTQKEHARAVLEMAQQKAHARVVLRTKGNNSVRS